MLKKLLFSAERCVMSRFLRKSKFTSLLCSPSSFGADYRRILSTDANSKFLWMKELENPKTQQAIEREHNHALATLKKSTWLKKKIFEEIKDALIVPNPVPEQFGERSIFTQYDDEFGLPILYSQSNREGSNPEQILNVNQILQDIDSDYLMMGETKISHDFRLIAFSIDFEGLEHYRLFIHDTLSKRTIFHPFWTSVGTFEFGHSRDGKYFLFFTKLEQGGLRPCNLYRTSFSDDGIKSLPEINQLKNWDIESDLNLNHEHLLSEDDKSFFMSINKTKDQKYITVNVNSKTMSEVYLLQTDGKAILDSNNNNVETTMPVLFQRRSDKVEYFVEHNKNNFFVITNAFDTSKDLQLAICPEYETKFENWSPLSPCNLPRKVNDIDAFDEFIAVYEMENAKHQIRVIPRSKKIKESVIESPMLDKSFGSVISIEPGLNSYFNSKSINFYASSIIHPSTIFEYTPEIKRCNEISKCEFPDLSNSIELERVFATSNDKKTLVPLTIAYSRDLKVNSNNPCLLSVYGSYGECLDIGYHPEYIPLLNRGWIIAFAHVRGGGELGKQWYYSGRQLEKENTFSDFIGCAEYLIDNRYTSSNYLAAYGMSAGGLVLGVVANRYPDLFRAMILEVPFLDILEVMTDKDSPLTVHEYDEWGNPSNKRVYEYISRYDPCRNLKKQDYPHMLLTSSINDTRVEYWHALKWVTKLKTLNTAHDRDILLLINESAGHFGSQSHLEHLEKRAMQYSFLYQALELNTSKKY